MARPIVAFARSGLRGAATAAPIAALLASGAAAQMSHDHHGAAGKAECKAPTLACAAKATPAFGPDGALWLAWDSGGHVSVARSPDLGRSFAAAVKVNASPLNLDWGPDARPSIVVDGAGRITVAFAIFRDKAFNGQVFHTRSVDGGTTFSEPQPITKVQESQRFVALALDAGGEVFAAWLDKRNRVPAKEKGEKYVGAALAFAWSGDAGATVTQTELAQDNTCECCRLGVAFAGPGRPVVAFRNVFDKTVRDHAVITFVDKTTPGPVHRISVDDWKTDACPHQGPSLSISGDGTYHATWFTSGRARKGNFYAQSRDGGTTFSEPMQIGAANRAPTRPFVLAAGGAVWLAWKQFDGDDSVVAVQRSADDGRSWSEPRVVARTRDASDHPLLIAHGAHAFLSWQTAAEGYRLIALEATQ